MQKFCLGVAAVSIGCIPSALFAQAAVGVIASIVNNPAHCFNSAGRISDKETEEARQPIINWMRQYWQQTSTSPAANSTMLPLVDGQVIKINSSGRAIDPLAHDSSLNIDLNPKSFIRSGYMGVDASTVWRVVRKSDSSIAGYYYVLWWRNFGKWTPRKAILFVSEANIPPVTPYCEKPGDVDAYNSKK